MGRASSHLASQRDPERFLHDKGMLGRLFLGAFENAPNGGHENEEKTGQKAAQEKFVDGRVGYHAVKNDRQAGRKQQPQGAGRCQKAQRVAIGVFLRDQDGHEQTAQGQDRDARPACKTGEKGANQASHDGRAALHGTEKGLEHPEQPFGGATLGQEITGQGEKRDGRDGRRHYHAVGFRGYGRDRGFRVPKEDQGRAAQGHENRGSQDDGRDQDHEGRDDQGLGGIRDQGAQACQPYRDQQGQDPFEQPGRGAQNQPYENKGKTQWQDKQDNPGGDAEGNHVTGNFHIHGEAITGFHQEKRDGGPESVSQNADQGLIAVRNEVGGRGKGQ